jgi:hypothetical protein
MKIDYVIGGYELVARNNLEDGTTFFDVYQNNGDEYECRHDYVGEYTPIVYFPVDFDEEEETLLPEEYENMLDNITRDIESQIF